MEDWVVQKLKNNLRGDILLDSALLQAASTDSSIFKITPSAVAVLYILCNGVVQHWSFSFGK